MFRLINIQISFKHYQSLHAPPQSIDTNTHYSNPSAAWKRAATIYHSDWKWSLFDSTLLCFHPAVPSYSRSKSQTSLPDANSTLTLLLVCVCSTLLFQPRKMQTVGKKKNPREPIFSPSLDHVGGGGDVLHAVQTEDLPQVGGQHKRRRLQLQLVPAQDRALCGYVRPPGPFRSH